ncbi:MAG: DUF4180 domain-containing protein [Flavobacteriales bacterium]|nr:DUF4180 domain-containing protein [Flavobacteriales bacterium]
MNFEIVHNNGENVAILHSANVEIRDAQDALEMLMNARYQECEVLQVQQHHLPESFFDLKTGLAGEILLKFSTYGGRLIVVGNFENITSKSLRDFIFESNKVGRIRFVSS